MGGWPKLMRRAAGMGSQSQWYARLWLSLDGADVILQCTLDVGPCTMGPVMARGNSSCMQEMRFPSEELWPGWESLRPMWLPLRRRRRGRRWHRSARPLSVCSGCRHGLPTGLHVYRGQIKRWTGRERWKRGEGCRSCGLPGNRLSRPHAGSVRAPVQTVPSRPSPDAFAC